MPSSRTTTEPTLHALQALRDGKLTGTWFLDGSKSEVRLRSGSMWGMAPVKGVFREVSGSGVITPEGELSGTIIVGAGSIDTRNKKRDDHLRSADFLEADKYPAITFTVDRVAPAGQGVSVAGSLTVRGQTRPLSFTSSISGFDGEDVWLDAEVKVNRSDFGMTWNRMGVAAPDNTITVHAVFARQ